MLPLLNFIPIPTDKLLPSFGLEILTDECWIPADPPLWRAWTGRRRLWTMEYHGPVTALDAPATSPPFHGARACQCKTCQVHVAPAFRAN